MRGSRKFSWEGKEIPASPVSPLDPGMRRATWIVSEYKREYCFYKKYKM